MSSKILILMRHAKPVSDAGVSDFYIPLSKMGVEVQKRLCEKLQEDGFYLEKVYASPFTRTRETAAVVAQHFNQEYVVEEALGDLFDETRVLEVLEKDNADTIALVGHGPSLTEMANNLIGKKVFKDIFSKSSAVILEFQGGIKKGTGTLLKYLLGA